MTYTGYVPGDKVIVVSDRLLDNKYSVGDIATYKYSGYGYCRIMMGDGETQFLDYDEIQMYQPEEDISTCGPSDGLTASYYELPEGATELYHLIIHKNMNAQVGEAFRSLYRYGGASHSDQLRDCRKVLAYMKQEEERLLMGKREDTGENT